jgi:putative flippase GtrA
MERIKCHSKIVKYVISGGSAACVNIGSFAILHHHFNLWYLLSSIFAYGIAFFVSFILQKFWTFNSLSKDKIRREVVFFLSYNIFGLVLNTALVYMFVEFLLLNAILAQIIAGLSVALCSFFVYRSIFTVTK